MRQNQAILAQEGANHRHQSCDVASTFGLHDHSITDGTAQLFDTDSSDVKATILSFRTCRVDARALAWVYRFMRIFITQVQGVCAYCILTASQCLAQDDIVNWISTAHHSVLAKNRVFILNEGDSLYVPLGCLPVVVPLPYDSEHRFIAPAKGQPTKGLIEVEQYSHAAVTLVLDKDMDGKASIDTLQMALANWSAHQNRVPRSIRGTKRAQEWLASAQALIDASLVNPM